jgi:tetratricopeptide (TPR) repeat protein
MRWVLLVAAMLLWIPLAPAPVRAAQGGAPVETAEQQYQQGRFAQAAETLQQAINANPNNAALYYWLGRCYFELRNYEQASTNAEKAVRLDGQNSDYHLWLARIYGRLADTHRSLWLGMKTRKEFESAVELDPKNIPARRDLTEFYTQAPWIVGGSRKKAQDQIAAIAAIDPVQGALAQAEFDRQTGDSAGAETQYQKVLGGDPGKPEEFYEIADFYAGKRNAAQLQKAIDGVLRIAPSDPRLGYYQGVVLEIEGDRLPEAERYLKAYLATTVNRSDYPSHADARTWLGHVYEKLGRRLEAAEQYRAALAIDPNSSFAKQSLKRLEKQVN